MKAKDVTDLHEAPSDAGRGFQLAPLRGRPGERLLDEAVPTGGQALGRDCVVTIRRGDDVHRVDVRER